MESVIYSTKELATLISDSNSVGSIWFLQGLPSSLCDLEILITACSSTALGRLLVNAIVGVVTSGVTISSTFSHSIITVVYLLSADT